MTTDSRFVRAVLPIKYLTSFASRADLLIDHGDVAIPWLSPLYSRKPRITIIHQLVKEIFYYEWGRPLADAACFLEKMVYKPYVGSTIVAVSNSTAEDLFRLGIGRESVHVISPACNYVESKVPLDARRGATVTCVTRFMKYKGLELALAAFQDLLTRFPSATLEIAGYGPDERNVRQTALDMKLTDHVQFLGRVSDPEKAKLYGGSRVLLYPSVREGYGISVIEANAFGTPVVGWDVPGVRDSVRNGSTGLLAPFGDKAALSKNIETLLTNDAMWDEFSENAWIWSRKHSWDESAELFESVIENRLGNHN